MECNGISLLFAHDRQFSDPSAARITAKLFRNHRNKSDSYVRRCRGRSKQLQFVRKTFAFSSVTDQHPALLYIFSSVS